MGVNIKIPYLEVTGETQISLFKKIYFIAKTITDYLIAQKGDFVVSDPVSFMLKLGNNFLNVADTFIDVAKAKKDSNSAYSLFRIQADYLVTLLLIFEGKDEDELKFRYLLYFIDGLSQRVESLKEIPQYNGDIYKEDYDALLLQMKKAKENAEQTLDFCLKEINRHPYKAINSVLFDKILSKKQWKYKEFNKTAKYEYYQWKDLYTFIDKRQDIAAFISLCSHYIHGNVNSLMSGSVDEDFDPIVHFNSVLIERYIKLLKSLYGENTIKNIINYCMFGIPTKGC